VKDFISKASMVLLLLCCALLGATILAGSVALLILMTVVCVPIMVSAGVLLRLWGLHGSVTGCSCLTGEEDLGRLQPWDGRSSVRSLHVFRETRRLREGSRPDRP